MRRTEPIIQVATDESDVLGRIVACASADERIRVVVLSSSRVRLGARLDIMSDYDVDMYVWDFRSFVDDHSWARYFGEPLLTVRDAGMQFDLTTQNHMVLYEDGTKIDWSILPIEVVHRFVQQHVLPDGYIEGYRVLLDKDAVFTGLPEPSGSPYVSIPPTAGEFRALIEEWWWCATYVAKYLVRGSFMPVKLIFDHEMKHLILGRMFGWRIGIDHHWSVNPGFFSRNLDRYVEADVWQEFQATYVGPSADDNWDALDRANEMFRKLARGVAVDLGFEYPERVDHLMTVYLNQIKQLRPRAS